MYEEFKKANPDFQSRIEAFTSGILSPDSKGITLVSMDPSRAYTYRELYKSVCAFSGFDPGLSEFPLTHRSIWGYCDGTPSRRLRSSLDSIGAVVKLKAKRRSTSYRSLLATAYQKTDAGRDFGDPIVAMGTYTVNEITKRKPKYSSLWRLLGSAPKSPETRYRAGFTRYKIIKFLSENPTEEFRREDIILALSQLDDTAISNALNSLGEAGAIDFYSPYRDVRGEKVCGWAEYILVKSMRKK